MARSEFLDNGYQVVHGAAGMTIERVMDLEGERRLRNARPIGRAGLQMQRPPYGSGVESLPIPVDLVQ